MKAIISHDVDHLTASEHKFDLVIQKYLIRSAIEWTCGYITAGEVFKRLDGIRKNRWQNLESLLKYDKENNIHSVFFVAMSKGCGLRYGLEDARFWIRKIIDEGFEIGVHGIAYDNLEEIQSEYSLFKKCSGLNAFGIRMHYLRGNWKTLDYLEDCGYLYDASMSSVRAPFKKNDLWEFPLNIMDGDILYLNRRWQNQSLRESIESTKRIIETCYRKNVPFLSILFHDRYYSESFRTWMDWYIWITSYLKENGIPFVNYSTAIRELEGKA